MVMTELAEDSSVDESSAAASQNGAARMPRDYPVARPASNEFNYVPLTPLAPIACVLGLCSATGMISVILLPVAIVGAFVGLIALFKIRRLDGELCGRGLAWSGVITSVLFFVSGIGVHVHAYTTEVPEGYQRVNFPRDISDKEFVFVGGRRKLHPDVERLIGQPLFLKGWMYQTMKQTGLTEFVLLKDNGECCFGGDPKPFDMIQVRMQEGLTTKGYLSMISVAGVLSANPSAPEGEPVYTLEARQCGLAKSSF